MYARSPLTLLYALFALSVLAVATPWNVPTTTDKTVTVTATVTAPGSTTTTVSQCNTGSLQCCDSTVSVSQSYLILSRKINLLTISCSHMQSSSTQGLALLGLLGIVLGDVTGLLGLGCSPLSIVGIGSGNACTASPVCCENNSVVRISICS